MPLLQLLLNLLASLRNWWIEYMIEVGLIDIIYF